MQIHLKVPVEVSINGRVEKSEFLNIEDPNRGNIIDASELQEIGAAAIMSAQVLFQGKQSESKEESESSFDESSAIMILKMGKKYKAAIAAFDSFLYKYGSFDDVRVQTGSLSRMDIKDYENALGSYFAAHCFFGHTQP